MEWEIVLVKKKKGDWDHIQKKKGHKSGLETQINEQLEAMGIDGEYEKHKIKYIKPETKHTYKPDFRLPNGIFIESKGRLMPSDRKKHLYIKKQHPELDIRFIFGYAKGKIRKGSKTTYAQWAEKHGFKWAEKEIPKEWLDEPPKGTNKFFG